MSDWTVADLDAIREDVAMAARSAEMARHVALDHAPELLDEVERLRAEVERLTPRRVETAEELDSAPAGQRNMWDGFCDDCECIHCKPMDSEPWHGKASS